MKQMKWLLLVACFFFSGTSHGMEVTNSLETKFFSPDMLFALVITPDDLKICLGSEVRFKLDRQKGMFDHLKNPLGINGEDVVIDQIITVLSDRDSQAFYVHAKSTQKKYWPLFKASLSGFEELFPDKQVIQLFKSLREKTVCAKIWDAEKPSYEIVKLCSGETNEYSFYQLPKMFQYNQSSHVPQYQAKL